MCRQAHVLACKCDEDARYRRPPQMPRRTHQAKAKRASLERTQEEERRMAAGRTQEEERHMAAGRTQEERQMQDERRRQEEEEKRARPERT